MYQLITIVGRVGKNAELSYTPTGIAVSKFSVAVSKVTGKGENKQEKTTWFRVTIWRERAENLSQYIKAGNLIMVVGEIDASAYTNKDGNPTSSLELTGNEIKFLSSKREEGNAPTPYDNDEFDESAQIPF